MCLKLTSSNLNHNQNQRRGTKKMAIHHSGFFILLHFTSIGLQQCPFNGSDWLHFVDSVYTRHVKHNMWPVGRMRSFASTPVARTKNTVIWSFNGQNCSFYNLNWINVRRSQKNGMLFFIQDFFTLGNMIDYFKV
jgi:hypothetical protein